MSDFDWNQPIRVPLRGTAFGIRDEQLRRAAILVEAAGATMPKGDRAKAVRVAALASIVPALQYSRGGRLYRELAPDVTIMASSSIRPGPGRKVEWPRERYLALVEMVEDVKAGSSRPLTDKMALARVKKRMIEYGRRLAESEGVPFEGEPKRRFTLPSVERLENCLAEGRAIRRAKEQSRQ